MALAAFPLGGVAQETSTESLTLVEVNNAAQLIDGGQYVLKYTGPNNNANYKNHLYCEETPHTSCVDNNQWQGTGWNATGLLGENPGILRFSENTFSGMPTVSATDGQYLFTLEADAENAGRFFIKAQSDNYVDGRDFTEVVSGKGVPVHTVDAATSKTSFVFEWDNDNLSWNIGNGAESGRNYLNAGGVENGAATLWNNDNGTDKGRIAIYVVSTTVNVNLADGAFGAGNSDHTFFSEWTHTDAPQLTLTCGPNNMAQNGTDINLFGSSSTDYTLTAPEGWMILSYAFDFTNADATQMTVTPEGGEAVQCTGESAHVSATGINASTAVFNVNSGENTHAVCTSNFTVTLAPTPGVSITYNYKYNGEQVGTWTTAVGLNSDLPAPEGLPDFTTATAPEGIASATQSYDVEVTPAYPFEVSPTPTDGQFAEDTHWYALNIRSTRYVRSTAEGSTSATSVTQTAPDLDETDFWCFTMGSGLTVNVYNLSKGADAPLHVESGDGSKSDFGTTATDFDVVKNGSKFLLRVTGTEAACLNDVNGNFAIYNSVYSLTDDGSSIVVTAVEDIVEELTGWVGGRYPDVAFTAEPTTTNLRAACAVEEHAVEFDAAKYYRIYNVRADESMSSALVSADAAGTTTGNIETSEVDGRGDYAILWQFEAVDGSEDTYKLRNLNAGYYQAVATTETQAETQADHAVITDADNASTLTIGEGTAATNWTLAVTNNTSLGENVYLNAHHSDDSNTGNPNSHAIGTWRNGASDAGNRWKLQLVDFVSLNVSSAEWATLCLPFAVSLPEGVTAYTGRSLNDAENTFTLTPVTVSILPANTPVVVNAPEGTYALSIVYGDETPAITPNLLSGATVERTGFGEDSFYALANLSSGVGFYTNGTVGTVAANKAYIDRTITAAEATGYRFVIDDTPTVGIDSVTIPDDTTGKTYYDLQGRRVLYPSHGVYVTGDGQKVFIK